MPEAPNIQRNVLGAGLSVKLMLTVYQEHVATSFQAIANIAESMMAGMFLSVSLVTLLQFAYWC